MATKTLYLKPDENGWCTAICIRLNANDDTIAEETAYIKWELQAKTPAGELWTSNRGERATSLSPVLNPDKFFDEEKL